jgi:tetratricopeptide (TPR) repeat protein
VAEARLLQALGRGDEALAAVNALLATVHGADDLNNACYTLAKAKFMLERALDECDAALKLRPTFSAALDSRAFVLMRLGRLKDALDAYSAAVAANSKSSDSLYGRGLVEAKLGLFSESSRDIAQAAVLRPHIREIFQEMGVE